MARCLGHSDPDDFIFVLFEAIFGKTTMAPFIEENVIKGLFLFSSNQKRLLKRLRVKESLMYSQVQIKDIIFLVA